MPVSAVHLDVKQPKSILKDRNMNMADVKTKIVSDKHQQRGKSTLNAAKIRGPIAMSKCGGTTYEADSDAVPRKFDLLRVYSPSVHRLIDAVDEFAVPEPSLLFEESNLHLDEVSPAECSGSKSPLALSCSSSPIKPAVVNREERVTASNGPSAANEIVTSHSATTDVDSAKNVQPPVEVPINIANPAVETLHETKVPVQSGAVQPPNFLAQPVAPATVNGVPAPQPANVATAATVPQPFAVGQAGSAFPFYGYPWQPQSLYAAANAFWLNQLQQQAVAAGYPAAAFPMQMPGYHMPAVRATTPCPPAPSGYPTAPASAGPLPAVRPVAPLMAATPSTNLYRLLVEQDRQLKQLQKQVAQLLTVTLPQPQQSAVVTNPSESQRAVATNVSADTQAASQDVQTMTTATNTTIMWQKTTTTTTCTTMTTLIEQQSGGTPKKGTPQKGTPKKGSAVPLGDAATPRAQMAPRALTHDHLPSSTPDERTTAKRQANALNATGSRLFDDRRKDDSLFESENECRSDSDAEVENERRVAPRPDRRTVGSGLSDNVFADDEMRDSSASDDVRLTSVSSIEQPRRCNVDTAEYDSQLFANAVNEPASLLCVAMRDKGDCEITQHEDEATTVDPTCQSDQVHAEASLPKLMHVELADSFQTDSSRFAGQQGSAMSQSASLNATAASSTNRQLQVSCGALLERINVLLNSSLLRNGVSTATCEAAQTQVSCSANPNESIDRNAENTIVGQSDNHNQSVKDGEAETNVELSTADISRADDSRRIHLHHSALNDSTLTASSKQSWLAAATTNESVNVDVLLTKHRLFMLEAASGAHLHTNASTLSVNTTQGGASFVDVLDGLALKYLDDAELSRITRELNASAAVCSANETRVASSTGPANMTLFGMNANNVSLATRRYLEKHRLIAASSNDCDKSESNSVSSENSIGKHDATRVRESEVRSRDQVLEVISSSHIAPLAISSGVKAQETVCSSVNAAGDPPSTIAFESSNSVRFGEASSIRVNGALHQYNSTSASQEAASVGADSNTDQRSDRARHDRHREHSHRHSRSAKVVTHKSGYPTTASSSTTAATSSCAAELEEGARATIEASERREHRHTRSHKRTERNGSSHRSSKRDQLVNTARSSKAQVMDMKPKCTEQAGCALPAQPSETIGHNSSENACEQDLADRILDITRIKQLPKLM